MSSEKNEEMKIFTDETSKINKEVRKQNKEFRDEITYWEKEAKDIGVQLEQALNVENNLRTWVTKLEQEEATNKTIKRGLDKNINTMKMVHMVVIICLTLKLK